MDFMNDFDLDYAKRRFADTPNRRKVALVVASLADWADRNSDGWAYWPLPCRAASKAVALIRSTTSAANDAQERVDATDAEVTKALAPIKAFLTRQGVSAVDRARILQAA